MPHAFETVVLSSYEGQWEEDQPDGEGSYKWSDGSSYEGNMEEGKMHGQGRFVWPDGSSYEGSWFQGALHGQGRFDSRFDGGRYMQGQFHYNCFQKSDGRWIDILQHIKSHELREILEGNPLTQRVEPETAKKTKTKATKTTKGASCGGSILDYVLGPYPIRELKQALNDQTVAIEELQVLMQALFDQQTSLLVREMCRTANRREPKEGQVCTVLTPMPTIDELDQLEEKTMVSVNPDEDQTPSAEDEAEENQNHLQVPHDTRLSTQSTVTQRSTTTGIDVVALNTSDSMNPVQRLPVSEVVQAASTLSTSKRDSGRYTFVRANMDQHQERATSVALERGINGAVNLARRASQYQPHIDQSNANSQFLFNLVTSRRFMHGMMLVILLNLILLGIEVEISSKKSLDDISPFFFIANIIIVCVYVIEMLLKMTAFGVA
eukprot:symbB.v1.2.010343.t1/scaffold675.1/size173442/1